MVDLAGADYSATHFRIAPKADAGSVNFVHKLWQLEQLGRRAPSRLILEIDVSKLLAVRVAHNETRGIVIVHGPGRREATRRRRLPGHHIRQTKIRDHHENKKLFRLGSPGRGEILKEMKHGSL